MVAHVVHRFDVGGLENGVVNLVNHLPARRFRHAIVALTEVTDFRRRIRHPDTRYFSLHKASGHGLRVWPSLYRLFRSLRPHVVHTRNLGPLEACVPAWFAGVKVRVHGEHGWDVGDLDGSNRRHRLARRLYRPFVSHYVALSRHIEDYLCSAVGVLPEAVSQIYNGVDVHAFVPPAIRMPIEGSPFNDPHLWVVGTVGRLAAVKDQATLVRAVSRIRSLSRDAQDRVRLVIVGGGPLFGELKRLVDAEHMSNAVWLAGERDDIPQVMSGLDAFALPSLAEGISNTLLEAMACARPVVATAVGGNVELVRDGATGFLVPRSDPPAVERALMRYFLEPDLALRHGAAARAEVEGRFSLERMTADYAALYERLLASGGRAVIESAVGGESSNI